MRKKTIDKRKLYGLLSYHRGFLVPKRGKYSKPVSLPDCQVVKKRLEGKGTAEIAEEMTEMTGEHYDRHRVARILKREEIQPMLEREAMRLASHVPEVTDNVIHAAQSFRKKYVSGSEDPYIDQKVSWEANKIILQAHGMLPSNQQSVVHQTFINQQNNILIPKVIQELASRHFGGLLSIPESPEAGDVIDMEDSQ